MCQGRDFGLFALSLWGEGNKNINRKEKISRFRLLKARHSKWLHAIEKHFAPTGAGWKIET